MDVCYYNSQIKEELDGAIAYIKRAINCKKEHPDWSSMYAKMSEMELDHATTLLKIFQDEYSEIETDDPIYSAVHKTINDMYTEFAAKIKYMHEIYKTK